MTIVIARKFENRIIVLSDTQITNDSHAHPNIFPGRLKCIVINTWLTIAYAGMSDHAYYIIRNLMLDSNINTDDALQILLEASANGETDFILCSHERQARLVKISNGRVSEGNDYYWAGNSQAVSDFQKMNPLRKSLDIPEVCTAEEVEMKAKFFNFLANSMHQNVGGLAIDCLCSPCGHCYNSSAGSSAWDVVAFGSGQQATDSEAREKHVKTGMHHFAYTVNAPNERGFPIITAFFWQADLGYLYDATTSIEPRRINSCTGDRLNALMKDAVLEALSRKAFQ